MFNWFLKTGDRDLSSSYNSQLSSLIQNEYATLAAGFDVEPVLFCEAHMEDLQSTSSLWE